MSSTAVASYIWPVLLFLGIGLRVTLRVLYGARGPKANDPLYALINILGWLIILVAVAPLLLVSGLSVIGSVFLLIAVATLIEVVLAQRTTLRKTTCSLLSLVAARRGPVDASVLALAAQDRGIVGRETRRLMAKLDQGTSLLDAIRKQPRALPREAAAFAEIGELIGAQAAALDELSRPEDAALASLWQNCVDRSIYLAMVVFFMCAIGTFMMLRILPEFRAIFEDFDLQLPALTEWVIGCSEFIAHYLLGLLIVGIVAAILAGVMCLLYLFFDRHMIQSLSDRNFRACRVADVLRLLALAAEYKHPFSPVLQRLATVYPARSIRRPLAATSRELAAGGDWRDALLRFRLISRAEHALLGTAQEVGNVSWALRNIAARGERRLAYRIATIVQLAYPLVVLVLGGMVGIFVVAMFMPLVKLIHSMA